MIQQLLIILKKDDAYLASLMADAIVQSVLAGLVHNTMVLYLKKHNFLDRMFFNS